MLDLPAAIFLGVVCGLLGAFFIYVSITLSMLRKQHVNTPIKKVLECVLFAFVTASVFFGVVLLRANDCRPKDTVEGETYEF
jgi:H+/Cl- antiporter ClcA